MTADSKFFGPAPDMVGQAGGARFDAKRVSDQVWILEVRPLVDKPGTKVTGDQVVAVLQWIAAEILGIPSAESPLGVSGTLEPAAPKPERHLRLVPNPSQETDAEGFGRILDGSSKFPGELNWRCPNCGDYYEQQGKCQYPPCSGVLLLPQELVTSIPHGICYRITPPDPDGGDAA